MGALFKGCADLFWLLTKKLYLLDSIEQKEKSILRDTYEKFYFWGAGFEAEQGGLDKILVSSTNIKDQILSLLLKIARILNTGKSPDSELDVIDRDTDFFSQGLSRKIDSAEVNGQR